MKYFIGIDQGTNSVGYAVVDQNYSVVKKSGKHLWGVRLFEVGQKADQRRMKRAQRRRLQRRKERIKLLQDIMYPLVASVDDSFFRKLKVSFLSNVKVDQVFGRVNISNLFDGDYSDKDFYKQFPSIYHLRKSLIEEDKQFDIRLVYLAIHNLIKYRGNFLYENEEFSCSNNSIASDLKSFFDTFADFCQEKGIEAQVTEDVFDKLKDILLDKKQKNKDKKDSIISLFKNSFSNKKIGEQITNLLLGYEGDLSVIFQITCEEDVDAEEKKLFKIKFSDESFEEKIIDLESKLNEQIIEEVLVLKKVYDSCKFLDILGEGNTYVYQGMLEKYEKYGNDLKIFRKLLRKNVETNPEIIKNYNNDKKKFKTCIAIDVKKGYSVGVRREATIKKDNVDVFKKIVQLFENCAEKDYILEEINNGKFLLPLNNVNNAVIPFQMQLIELKKIIENQAKYYPYLLEIKDKIVSILTFRRPYYVGVMVGKDKSKFSWFDQKINEKIYPWNFDELVDVEKVGKGFMENLTSNCIYFHNESVLPLCSISYEKYNVLNEINTIKINNNPISVEQKKDIFELFKNQKTVKVGDVAKLLSEKYGMVIKKDDIKTSTEGKFTSSLSSYIDMKRIMGNDFDEKIFEKIIEILTVFSDKKMRMKSLAKFDLSQEQIKRLVELKYKKWGRLSDRALNKTFDKQGRSILDVMFAENRHFNNIIWDESLGFKEQFMPKKEDVKTKLIYDEIFNQAFLSPAVKKTTWETLKIIKEITKIMGEKPSGIFIESTREGNVKKRSSSRIENIKKLYKDIKEDCQYYNSDISELLKQDSDILNKKLDKDLIYLYVMQMGRCMYSHEKLDINKLSETCEIDHIVPRCYIKDDSFSNRVLVLKNENQKKTSTLGILPEVINRNISFWEFLKQKGFMGNKKFFSLTKSEYDENDLKGFVNRQLVETSHSVKFSKEVLKEFYPECDIDLIKAGLSSQFRKSMTDKEDVAYYNFYKLRDLNDFHHAKDAYIACVLSMFTKYAYPVWGQTDEAKALKYKLFKSQSEVEVKKLVNKRYGIIIDKLTNGDYYDICDNNGELLFDNIKYNNILKTMDYNDCLVSKKLELDAFSDFYNETLSKKGDGKLISQRLVMSNNGEKLPLPPDKYGGYKLIHNRYFVNVTYKEGKKNITKLMGVPVIVDYNVKNGNTTLNDYFTEELKKENNELIQIDELKIYKYQLIKFDGQLCFVASNSEVQNATQLVVDKKYNKLLYYVSKAEGKLNDKLLEMQPEFEPLIQQCLIELSEKMQKDCFGLYNSFGKKLQGFVHNNLSNYDYSKKILLIFKLLHITSTGAGREDLGDFKLGSEVGRFNRKTILSSTTIFYDVSVTGFYKSIIKI